MQRGEAVDRIERIIEQVNTEVLPVPVRELWVYGDIALGLDPIDRLDVYLTKDILIDGSPADADRHEVTFGVKGIGTSVRAEWANDYPEYIATNANGYAAPEKCLANHLLPSTEPIHLEVCNSGFEANVTQRLEAAKARGRFEQLLDPRAVCVWKDGRTSENALETLRDGGYVFPTLEDALTMLGLDDDVATEAAAAVHAWRDELAGPSVRGEVV